MTTPREQTIDMLEALIAHASNCYKIEMDTKATLIRMRRLPLVIATFVGGAVTQLDFDTIPHGLFRYVFPSTLLCLTVLACCTLQLLNIGFRPHPIFLRLGLPCRHTPRIYGTFDGESKADVAMTPDEIGELKGVRQTLHIVLERLVSATVVAFQDNQRERETITRANVRLVQGITLGTAVAVAVVFFGRGGHTKPTVLSVGQAVWYITDHSPPPVRTIMVFLLDSATPSDL